MSHKRKKILIVSLAAGSGHVQTAKALKKTAELYFPELECRHIDIADYITPLLRGITVSGYGFLIAHLPKVWTSLFRLSDSKAFTKAYRALTDYLKMLNSFEFLNEVYAFQPDHIISTHFLPSEILTHALKKTGPIPITEVVTDYGIHPILVVKGIDSYIVATPEMKDELIAKFDIKPNTIHIFGIPIDPSFYEQKDIAHLKSEYHCPPDKPIVLVLSGGDGMIEISDVVTKLFNNFKTPLTIIAVAGHNKKLYKRLTALTAPSHFTYMPFGWTNNIPNLMAIADVVVSKPGGLTTTECNVSKVPMIAINPIPGQEEYNIEYIEKNHLGSYAKRPTDIVPLLEHYILTKYKKRDYTSVQSARKIFDFISSQ